VSGYRGNEHHRQHARDHGEQRVRQAAGPYPKRPRRKPGRPPRERPPQRDPRRGAGVGQDVGAVAERTAGGGRRPSPADDCGKQGGETGDQPAGGQRVAYPAVAGEQREGDQRHAHHGAEGGDRRVAPGESTTPVDARAEPVGVRQPGTPDGAQASGAGLDSVEVEGSRRRNRAGRADQLMGGVSHPTKLTAPPAGRPVRGRRGGTLRGRVLDGAPTRVHRRMSWRRGGMPKRP
jgi:hypothetical protein